MDGLIFTPRQADFLKDGSIFAQSPAKTSNTVVRLPLPPADSNRSEFEGASAIAPQAPVLHAPQPRLPTYHSRPHLNWMPEAAGSPQLPTFGQDDMAKQIRAKFENLVRASPLPKVVEQLVSPRGVQQIDGNGRISRDASRPPSWHAAQAPASIQSASGTAQPGKSMNTSSGHSTPFAVEAEVHPRLALETRLCSTLAGQPSCRAAGETGGKLLLSQAAIPGDAVLAEPEQHPVTRPTPAGQCTAPEAPQEQYHAGTPATQESAQQYPTASGPATAHQPSSNGTLAPACDSVNPADGSLEFPQQAQQDQQDTHCPVDTVTHAGAASQDAWQEHPEYIAGAVQSQDFSSMVSLSPSLKLDIPALDDILSSDLLTKDDGQATSQVQPHLQQVSQHDGNDHHHHYQQQQQSVDQQESNAVQQQEVAQRSQYPAGPEASQVTPHDRHALQSTFPAPAHQEPSSLGASAKSQAGARASSGQGMPCQPTEVQAASKPGHSRSDITALENSVADNAVAARKHHLAAERQGPSEAVIQSPAGQLASRAREGAAAAEQADSLSGLAQHLASGRAQSAAVGAANDADGSAEGVAAAHTHSTASHPTLENGVHASASSHPFSQHTPSSDHDSMRLQAESDEPGQFPTTEAVASEQVSAAADVHTETAADCPATAAEQKAATREQPQGSQQTSTTGSQQSSQHKRRQSSSSNKPGPSSKRCRRCVVTRSSQGGQVQPLLTAPSDVSWQDQKGVYETSRRGRVRYPPLAFWMHETKVHDKQGGAVAIQCPVPSPAPLPHSRPPPHPGPGPLARASSQAQPGTQASQPVPSVTHSHAQTKPESHAEAQSQVQSMPALAEMTDKCRKGAAKQVQRSRKRRATSPEAASTEPPRDPPSPPFPYPILAKRAPQVSQTSPGLDGVKQPAQKGTLAEKSQPPAGAAGNAKPGMVSAAAAADTAAGSGKKPSSKGKASRQIPSNAAANEAAANGGRALRHCSDESEAGPSAAPSSAAAAGIAKAGGQVGPDQSKAGSKLKRCGTCKNCLKAKSGHQGCLVLRAVREQQAASAAHEESQAAAHPAKLAAAAAVAEPAQTAKANLGHSLASQKKDRDTKCIKSSKAKANRGVASRQADEPNRNSNTAVGGRASKVSKAGSCPEGSIHSALTQAAELASDMEQPDAAEAAEALESLKNSPVGSGASQPAVSGPLAAVSGQNAAAPFPKGSPAEAAEEGLPAKRGRGRPRKPAVAKPLSALVSVGPKRGRGRPRKKCCQPGSTDGVQASGSSGSLPAHPALAVQLETGSAQAAPFKVKLEKDQQKLQPKSKGTAASGPPSTAPQLDREGNAEQPSTSGMASSPMVGWTAEQRAALQRAFLTVQPSQRNFWQHVAKQVPGKSALECCNCKFDELPTPMEKAKQTSRLMPGRNASPIQPPALKLAGGRVTKPSMAATKQWARQVRWQQRAQEQSDGESPQGSHHPTEPSQQRSKLGNPQRGNATSSLLAAIHKQDKADKYIDRILRKQGGRLRKFKAAPVPSVGDHVGMQQQSQHATTGVLAELQALGTQEPVDEDMYDSEQDHYFSEDDA